MMIVGRARGLKRAASIAFMLALILALAPLPAIAAATPTMGTPPVASPAASPAAADAVAIADRTTVSIDFPVGLRVMGQLSLPSGMTVLSFLYQAGYDEGWNLIDIPTSDIHLDTDGTATLNTLIDLQTLQVPLGARLSYRWEATTPGGQITSVARETDWYDTRQPWQVWTSDQIVLHTYGMDAAFATIILDSAQGTVSELERRYGLARSERLTLWIYPEADAFRQGLPPNFRESVVGGSVVGFPLIVAVIPPGSESEVGRVIPHEISHQVLFQATRNPFSLLPAWFDEGMATHIQTGGTSGYMGMVVAAQRQGSLFRLSSIAGSFPYAPAQASLAYAASWSAIAFIEDRWGEDGIAALIRAFGEGLPEDEAIPQALGQTMDQFDHDWRAWILASGSSSITKGHDGHVLDEEARACLHIQSLQSEGRDGRHRPAAA